MGGNAVGHAVGIVDAAGDPGGGERHEQGAGGDELGDEQEARGHPQGGEQIDDPAVQQAVGNEAQGKARGGHAAPEEGQGEGAAGGGQTAVDAHQDIGPTAEAAFADGVDQHSTGKGEHGTTPGAQAAQLRWTSGGNGQQEQGQPGKGEEGRPAGPADAAMKAFEDQGRDCGGAADDGVEDGHRRCGGSGKEKGGGAVDGGVGEAEADAEKEGFGKDQSIREAAVRKGGGYQQEHGGGVAQRPQAKDAGATEAAVDAAGGKGAEDGADDLGEI